MIIIIHQSIHITCFIQHLNVFLYDNLIATVQMHKLCVCVCVLTEIFSFEMLNMLCPLTCCRLLVRKCRKNLLISLVTYSTLCFFVIEKIRYDLSLIYEFV
jgi:hypothetical protein